MLLDIIIGRDANTQQLHITSTDGKINKAVGAQGSVPKNVSRRHAQLTFNDDGTCTIHNLNDTNVTRVAGLEIVTKHIAIGDLVELGEGRYILNWDLIKPLIPKTVDITPLKQVWDGYKREKIAFQIAERKFNALRGATGIITMLAIVCGFLWHDSPIYFVLYGLAIAITLGFTVAAYKKSASAPQKLDELELKFQKEYKCPECGHFMGNMAYDILIQNPCCPYCKTKYKK